MAEWTDTETVQTDKYTVEQVKRAFLLCHAPRIFTDDGSYIMCDEHKIHWRPNGSEESQTRPLQELADLASVNFSVAMQLGLGGAAC